MQSRIDWTTGGLQFYDLQQEEDKKHQEKQPKSNFNFNINKDFDPVPSKLSEDQRFKLIRSIGVECIQEDQLKQLLKKDRFIRCYDGFEPSGRMHIAQGILRAINVNKLVDAGCVFIFWVADWFAMLNNKYDGDIDKIKTVGRYFIEVWKAAGMKMSNVQFLWASDQINKRPNDYWLQVMDIARHNNIKRIKRCATALGRDEGDDLTVAQLFYPCMQCTDIFFLNVDICQLGIDQRKVNMLSRQYTNKQEKPIILSHGMISGLLEGQIKMSKSNPDSAIFMEDSEQQVNRKIKKAYCVPKIIEGNPIIDYTKNIIMQARSQLKITRKPQDGGDLIYKSYEELEKDYLEGKLHPGDLKTAVAKVINELIEPVRQHFKNNAEARNLLSLINSFKQSSEAPGVQKTNQSEQKADSKKEKKKQQNVVEKKEQKKQQKPKVQEFNKQELFD